MDHSIEFARIPIPWASDAVPQQASGITTVWQRLGTDVLVVVAAAVLHRKILWYLTRLSIIQQHKLPWKSVASMEEDVANNPPDDVDRNGP